MSGIVGDNQGRASGLVKAVAAGGGGLLQIKSTTKTDIFTSNATGPEVVTGMAVAITPTLSTSKILVRCNIVHCGGTNTYHNLYLYRDVGGAGYGVLAGAIGDGTGGTYGDTAYTRSTIPAHSPNAETHNWHPKIFSFEHLDNPATTSEVTYQIYRAQYGSNADTAVVNQENNTNEVISDGRYISTITATELAVGIL